jgi:hypothetical protein
MHHSKDYEAFLKDYETICRKHGLMIFGFCCYEPSIGEIENLDWHIGDLRDSIPIVTGCMLECVRKCDNDLTVGKRYECLKVSGASNTCITVRNDFGEVKEYFCYKFKWTAPVRVVSR